jgi:hypothetical protein
LRKYAFGDPIKSMACGNPEKDLLQIPDRGLVAFEQRKGAPP